MAVWAWWGKGKKNASVPGSLRIIDMPRIFPCCPNLTLNKITDFVKHKRTREQEVQEERAGDRKPS